MKMDFYICWSIDCESCRKEVDDIQLGKKAIEGFCEILENIGWIGTLFLMPEEIAPISDLLMKKAERGHELALHLHPDESGYRSGCLGTYSAREQDEIIQKAVYVFKKTLGLSPVSVRTGFGSANDATFKAFATQGFKQTSMSFPGRSLSHLASNWAGAPLFAHYANPVNRFLQNGLDLIEFPISVDWESMIWGGKHPQDLRVEFTDAKNHGFTIRKVMQRQIDENLPVKVLLPFTHNIYDYSDPCNFKRQTMEGMIEEIKRYGEVKSDLNLKGITLAEAGGIYRKTIPII